MAAMKVCAVLSGSIRLHHKSLAILRQWSQEHDLSVFIHTWKNVSSIHNEHWMAVPDEEPTGAILDSFHPTGVIVEDWESKRVVLLEQAERLTSMPFGNPITSINPLAMYYSMYRAYCLVPDIADYDVVVRMRFDNWVHGDIFNLDYPRNGWLIPAECDFGGINDRFGWMWVDKSNNPLSREWCAAYLNLYSFIDCLLRDKCEYSPEKLLAHSLANIGATVHRVLFSYSILGF